MVQHGLMGTTLPCTVSHEGAGTVVAVGPAVQGFQPGDRVMAGIVYGRCGTCPDCLGPESYTQYCARAQAYLGVTGDGFFAEYARIDARAACVLPERVSFATAAPLACAGCTVFRGVKVAGVKSGEWLAIVGSGGGLGHLGVQFARALGVNVVGVDARDQGLELSKKAGAHVVVDARLGHEKVVDEVHRVTNGEGVTATLNVSDADKAMATACAITKMHGTVVQIAQVRSLFFVALGADVDMPLTILQPPNVTIPFAELIFRDIRVRGSLICSAEEAREMLQIVAAHNVSVETNIFKGLGEIEKLVELAESGKMKGKGVIEMDSEQIRDEQKSGVKLV
jgi:propanol-preferring alcohol dehydrogenase